MLLAMSRPSRTATPPTFAEFVLGYPASVQTLAPELRKLVMAAVPAAVEQVDAADGIVAYGFAPGYKALVCTLIFSKSEIKLGFYRGSELDDPDRLLQGAGKVHKYVPIREAAGLGSAGLRKLLRQAVARAKERTTA
jgi:hypothetical protein